MFSGHVKKGFSFINPFFRLLKPRVVLLVVFTGLAGILCSSGTIHPFVGFLYLLSLALGAGAAGAINMWYDRDIDSIMSRTSMRPIPSGIIDPPTALDFALVLSFLSVFMMAISTNIFAATVFAFSIAYYVFVYTIWLKRRSIHSTLIGGLASSIAPIISNLAVDSSVNFSTIILSAIVFFWTPPHFFALSLVNFDDYNRANIPIMPCVCGVRKTKIYLLLFSFLVALLSFLPCLFVKSPVLYAVIVSILSAVWIYRAVNVFVKIAVGVYYSFFFYSIVYLFGIFSAVMIFSVF